MRRSAVSWSDWLNVAGRFSTIVAAARQVEAEAVSCFGGG